MRVRATNRGQNHGTEVWPEVVRVAVDAHHFPDRRVDQWTGLFLHDRLPLLLVEDVGQVRHQGHGHRDAFRQEWVHEDDVHRGGRESHDIYVVFSLIMKLREAFLSSGNKKKIVRF